MDSSVGIPALFRDDLVCIRDEAARPHDHGIVFTILKQNKVNWHLSPINGDGPRIRCRPEALRTATAEEIEAARAQAERRRPQLHLGQVVTVTGRSFPTSATTLWTVIKTHPDGDAALAQLGGDKGRYYRSIPRSMITPLSAEQITAMAAAAVAARSGDHS